MIRLSKKVVSLAAPSTNNHPKESKLSTVANISTAFHSIY